MLKINIFLINILLISVVYSDSNVGPTEILATIGQPIKLECNLDTQYKSELIWRKKIGEKVYIK